MMKAEGYGRRDRNLLRPSLVVSCCAVTVNNIKRALRARRGGGMNCRVVPKTNISYDGDKITRLSHNLKKTKRIFSWDREEEKSAVQGDKKEDDGEGVRGTQNSKKSKEKTPSLSTHIMKINYIYIPASFVYISGS